MKTREATLDDADLLSQLSVEIQEMHAAERPDFFISDVTEDYAKNFFTKVLENPNTQAWIAYWDDIPAGYLLIRLREGHENPFVYTQGEVHVDHIAVLSKYHGRGIGRALMEKAEQTAKENNLSRISLSVWEFNQPAIAFYEQLGGYSVASHNFWKKLD